MRFNIPYRLFETFCKLSSRFNVREFIKINMTFEIINGLHNPINNQLLQSLSRQLLTFLRQVSYFLNARI